VIFGSATGSGAIQFRCGNCKTRNLVQKQVLRAISSDARRLERVAAAARREAAAHQKAINAHHAESQQEEVARKNSELRAYLEALRGVLVSSLPSGTAFSFEALKIRPAKPTFAPGPLQHQEEPPQLTRFLPPPIKGAAALLPGSKRKQAEKVQVAQTSFQQAIQQYEQREARRQEELEASKGAFAKKLAEIECTTQEQHGDVDQLELRFKEGEPDAVVEYFTEALSRMSLPYEPLSAPRVAFSPQSAQLVLEQELPDFDVIPDVREYRYIKSRDEVTSSAMSASERRALYTLVIAQVALRTIQEAFRADQYRVVDTVVLNGHVATVDKRTGQDIHPCLVTARTTRDRFAELNLGQVDPIECLKGLNASLSRSPSELLPVRPVIEFDMADPRFIKEADVLSALDTRPNLMELSPKDFESLITNLFEKMGLETRLTQPSRDGGVDCVAYDMRPIFGGKVVIQAKRYKDTVGVSAVRDLFGTMQNEGATKGILVATSGYGRASHDFANGKPLELIEGANLLYLLHEHAGIDAKIEVPEDWVDPVMQE
jgi:restriction system protein